MDVDAARVSLILWSLVITGVQLMFFLLAPVFGFPLPYPNNLDILQIISPVVLGYLGSATHFMFRTSSTNISVRTELLGILVRGPLIIYAAVVIGITSAFWYSNR